MALPNVATHIAPAGPESSVAVGVHRDVPADARLSSGHIPALDGLRGIAILLVLYHHLVLYGGATPMVGLDRAVHLAGRAGWIGVDLFFVLSGFLITGILFDAKGGDHYFRNYFVRRGLRIFPLYYAVLFGVIVVAPLFLVSQRLDVVVQDQAWYWTYMLNWQIGRDGWDRAWALGHFWSLAVEEQYYLVWPVIVFAFSRTTLQRICGIMVIASILLRALLLLKEASLAAYVLAPARMDSLAIGSFLALTLRTGTGYRLLVRITRPVLLITGSLVLLMVAARRGLPPSGDPLIQTAGYTLIAIFFGAVLVEAVSRTGSALVPRTLGSRTLRFFGRYSYALYVFHHPLLFLPSPWKADRLPLVFGSSTPALMVFSIGATAVFVAVALVSWHLWEKQFLKLKALFPYGERAVAAQPALR